MTLARTLFLSIAVTATVDVADAGDLGSGQTRVLSWTPQVPNGSGHSSQSPSISRDGRFVAFRTTKTELAGKASNGKHQVVVLDRETDAYEVVSIDSIGAIATDHCSAPRISADGQVVCFYTSAVLDTGDMNANNDVYLHYRLTNTTIWASRTTLGTQPDAGCDSGHISEDGRYLVFQSYATNIVPGGSNGARHVYWRDVANGTILRASISPGGAMANAMAFDATISGDGQRIAFVSNASNLGATGQNVWVRDIATSETLLGSPTHNGNSIDGSCNSPNLSLDGRYVAFTSHASNLTKKKDKPTADVFRVDLKKGKTLKFSLKIGKQRVNGRPTGMSENGRWIVVTSSHDGFDRVHLIDAKKKKAKLASVSSKEKKAADTSGGSAISGNGKYVAFHSAADNLGQDADNKTDVFLRRR